MANTLNSDADIPAHVKTSRFICVRTQTLGWQEAGYVLLECDLPDATCGGKFPNTTWVPDPNHQYQPQDIYPLGTP